jgi:hypothetical protein
MRLLLLLFACNSSGLATSGLSHPTVGGTGACSAITDPAACDARNDCFALYSGDLPCNNLSCSNHFVGCQDVPALCGPGGGVCDRACTNLTPSCPSGFTNVFSDSSACCSSGCTATDKCPSPCTSDDQCGLHAYCRGALTFCSSQCQLAIGTAGIGICHRSCVGRDAHCACADDSDCPGFFTSCDRSTGNCVSAAPPVCHAECPACCAEASDIQYGEICICGSC